MHFEYWVMLRWYFRKWQGVKAPSWAWINFPLKIFTFFNVKFLVPWGNIRKSGLLCVYLRSVLSKHGKMKYEIMEESVQGSKIRGELDGLLKGRSVSREIRKNISKAIFCYLNWHWLWDMGSKWRFVINQGSKHILLRMPVVLGIMEGYGNSMKWWVFLELGVQEWSVDLQNEWEVHWDSMAIAKEWRKKVV